MSADNWAECPKCNVGKLEKIKTLEQKLRDSYGEVSEWEYNALKNRVAKIKAQAPEPSLREDYEIGIREGEFYINYGASCSRCQFEFTYNHLEDLTRSI